MSVFPQFEIKSYGWQELAQLYSPDLSPESAYKRLRRWVDHSPALCQALYQAGWRRGNRVLRPEQVRVLVAHLGEP